MIKAENLSKNLGGVKVVSDISFSASKGEILGFLGPNGAGKTTVIRMLSTYLPPTSGTAKVAGFDILAEAHEVRKRIGYLPETPPLYGEMRVQEYLYFVAKLKGLKGSDVRIGVENAIERCFLKEAAKKLCHHLSRGYRQRVGLAQAIIHNPEVIILDEPTTGLDPKQIIEIRELISSFSDGHTVILSTHMLQEVTMICSKVVIIHRGKVIVEGDLAPLLETKSLEEIFMECVSGGDVPEGRQNEIVGGG